MIILWCIWNFHIPPNLTEHLYKCRISASRAYPLKSFLVFFMHICHMCVSNCVCVCACVRASSFLINCTNICPPPPQLAPLACPPICPCPALPRLCFLLNSLLSLFRTILVVVFYCFWFHYQTKCCSSSRRLPPPPVPIPLVPLSLAPSHSLSLNLPLFNGII